MLTRSRSINIINICIKQWIKKINNLPSLIYNKHIINYKSLRWFEISDIKNNEKFNKERENIISSIINNKLDIKYYKYSVRWNNFKTELDLCLNNIYKQKNIKNVSTVVCKIKAGRQHTYDFNLLINNKIEIKVEFKFNCNSIMETPQFVQPMNPSKWLNINFEEWFYDNYISEIVLDTGFLKPDRKEYLKQINNNKVDCMKLFKKLYDSNESYNKKCKKIDKTAIKSFIQISNVDMNKFSDYLSNSQKDKIYMYYKNNKFYFGENNENLFKLTKLIKRENTNYIYETLDGMKIEIKLRFKNGCGLQFPAFQIKRKIPTVNELKLICKNNDIKPPKLKKDICDILDKNMIVY